MSGVPRHIRLLLAVLLGAAFFCLSPGARAHGHGGHHGTAAAFSIGATYVGLAEAGHHGARQHAACCAAGLGCPTCVSLPAEAGLALPAGRLDRPAAFSQPPPPSVVIETPSKPPRTV